jgi:hypothetical protein
LIDASGLQKMGPCAAEEDFGSKERLTVNSEEFDIRDESWNDGIRNQVGKSLFFVQGVLNSDQLANILDTNNEAAAGGVCKRNERLENRHRRGEIALELKRLSLGRCQKIGDAHGKKKLEGKRRKEEVLLGLREGADDYGVLGPAG